MMLFNSCRFSCQLWLLVFLCNFSYAEENTPPVSELQRRFMQLEQRALKLSEQIADTTGTEPIQLIDRNISLAPVDLESDAQESYNSLPGPEIEPFHCLYQKILLRRQRPLFLLLKSTESSPPLSKGKEIII